MCCYFCSNTGAFNFGHCNFSCQYATYSKLNLFFCEIKKIVLAQCLCHLRAKITESNVVTDI